VRLRLALIAGLAVLAGCGEDPPLEQASTNDRAQIDRVVQEWYAAFADGDGRAVCDRTADKTLEQVGGADSCETQIDRLAEQFIEEQRREIEDARVARAFVRGDEANVELDARTRYTGQMLSRTLGLRREDGEWKVVGTMEPVNPGAVTACNVQLLRLFEDGKVDEFWKDEGRADYRAWAAEVCRRAADQDLLENTRENARAQQRIAGLVMLKMIRSGRIRDPRE
jgi:ketosteroid isomerase-like protein